MAKKTVASLQKGEGRTYSKIIKMEKSPKTALISSKKKWCPTMQYRLPSNNRRQQYNKNNNRERKFTIFRLRLLFCTLRNL